jgi:hypothetical protein
MLSVSKLDEADVVVKASFVIILIYNPTFKNKSVHVKGRKKRGSFFFVFLFYYRAILTSSLKGVSHFCFQLGNMTFIIFDLAALLVKLILKDCNLLHIKYFPVL